MAAPEATPEDPLMSNHFRLRLSTMEIILIGTLLGSLVLALLQARQEERRRAIRELEALRDGH
jgi:hypothetical protein